jgi:hypothetical protein
VIGDPGVHGPQAMTGQSASERHGMPSVSAVGEEAAGCWPDADAAQTSAIESRQRIQPMPEF